MHEPVLVDPVAVVTCRIIGLISRDTQKHVYSEVIENVIERKKEIFYRSCVIIALNIPVDPSVLPYHGTIVENSI